MKAHISRRAFVAFSMQSPIPALVHPSIGHVQAVCSSWDSIQSKDPLPIFVVLLLGQLFGSWFFCLEGFTKNYVDFR